MRPRPQAAIAFESVATSVRPIITLTTDFGTRDPYAAAMKGVCLKLCSDANLIDLTHEIAHHDVLEGALFLGACAGEFPAGTIHCAVIDPGVGTDRQPIVAQSGGQVIVCPDNGLLTRLHQRFGLDGVWRIEHEDCFAESVSHTFHGRDVFAVTSARLANGMSIDDVGSPITEPELFAIAKPRIGPGNTILGEVIHVDRFGNLITNIDDDQLGTIDVNRLRIGDLSLDHVSHTYGDVNRGEPLALVGGSGLLEIAINCGSASVQFGLGRNERIRISA